MEYLLDTCTFLWALQDNNELPQDIKDIINDKNNDVYVSYVSLWEIEIKHLKKPELMPIDVKTILNILLECGIASLPIHYSHFAVLDQIANQHIHSDPFDHMILATALCDEMTLITHDSNIKRYQGVNIINY